MRRRDLITLLCVAAAWPLAAGAQDQPRKLIQIGVLSLNTPADHARNPRFRAFYRTMRELSWIDRVNIAYDQRYAEGQVDRLPQLARELVAAAPDVIVTASTPPALAAKAATSTIPIVILDPGDPVATGLVSSLAQPGGNVTGVSSMAPDLAAKRFEILHEAVPGVTRVAVLFNAAIPHSEHAARRRRRGDRITKLLAAPAHGRLWHTASIRCGANDVTLLGVKRTLRAHGGRVEVKRLT